MNREIKFRGKRLDNGEWVYGFLIDDDLIGNLEEAEYNSYSIGCGVEDRGCNDRYDGAEYGYEQAREDILQNTYLIDPATVGQFTGLKDREGVEIYEGDVVSSKAFETIRVEVCEDIKKLPNYAFNFWRSYGNDFRCEVIGNIHDNPELIK